MTALRSCSTKSYCAAALMALVAAVGWSRPALAEDEISRCIASYEQAQTLRAAAKLRASRAQVLICTREVCPALLRADCGKWLDELGHAQPTVVLSARDEHGRELAEVRVSVDGELLAERLDGRAIAVDPGLHRFRFERAQGASLEQQVTIREAEKLRSISVAWRSEASEQTSSSGAPASAWVLGGIGAIGMAGFTYFGIRGLDQKAELADCKPNCTREDVDSVRQSFQLADICLGVGLIGLGSATWIALSNHEPGPEQPALAAGAGYAPGRAGVALWGSF